MQIPSDRSAFDKVESAPLAADVTFTKAVGKLRTDHALLTTRLQKLQPIYGDAALDEHIARVTGILEKSMHDVMQHADPVGKYVWRQAMADLRKHVNDYKHLLDNVKERKELKETKECIDQLDALFRHIYAGQTKDDKSDRLLCCVCQEVEVNVSIACGHLLCAACSQSVDKCPMCRQKISAPDIRHVFL